MRAIQLGSDYSSAIICLFLAGLSPGYTLTKLPISVWCVVKKRPSILSTIASPDWRNEGRMKILAFYIDFEGT